MHTHLTFKMELLLVTIAGILCSIVIMKLLSKLRLKLPWRVNCWFCNSNFWMKYVNRNCWTCPKCEQYNGFTKDGDYNKVVCTTSDQSINLPKVFRKTLPRNGLCKMCNINQQLKVVQLANFVPMNENNFNDEVESYKLQLEKAYKLCSPCKKVLQIKLHKEKETLLGTKLLQTRTPDKMSRKKAIKSQTLKLYINRTSTFIAWILVVLVSVELYNKVTKKSLPSALNNLKEVLLGLIDRTGTVLKMKALMTFPSFEDYFNNFTMKSAFEIVPKYFVYQEVEENLMLTQKILGGFVCLMQIIGHIWNINKFKYTIIIDLLWTVFVTSSVVRYPKTVEPLLMSLIKLTSTFAVLLVYNTIQTDYKAKEAPTLIMTPKKMKNISNGSNQSLVDEEDTLSLDTDDDVSLSKFGLHNLSDSSHENIINSLNNSRINGRSFTPHNDSLWKKPKHNSTYCVNSVVCKSPSSVSDNVFIKPSFNKYQKLSKEDSDSDLDESISSLCIGSPKKKHSGNSIFSLRKFNATPSFVAPTPLNRARPLISPSKLGHSTSWVAGGYWGSEAERQIFHIDGSRSSSQSSGFESQASSMNQRNVFSQPPSREESVCGEPMVVDNFRSCTTGSFSSYQTPHNFTPMGSPVFPQMQFNSHVQIPQPRFAQQKMATQTVFGQHQNYGQNNIFKAPGGLGLIKLPRENTFSQ